MIHTIPPAQLWVGDHEKLIKKTIDYLATLLCANNACTTCTTCMLVAEQRHHATLWLMPEKQYTLASLEPITRTLAFSLEQGHRFFFIIQKADSLSPAVQNMLLKTIEEPPQGYHFIFLAEHKDALLPTVQSRCHMQTVHQEGASAGNYASLVYLFTTALPNNLLQGAEELEKKIPTEQESNEVLNTIIAYWMKEYLQKNSPTAHKKLTFFLRAQQQPPMPGSSKLFWKNLVLQWHYHVTA